MENDLKWFFGPSASEEHGPKDSITTTFKGDKYYSLAREVNQNSLDAINDSSSPVRVKFSLFDLQRSELNEFFELNDIFSKCSEYFPSDKKFNEFCGDARTVLSGDKIKCLRISDYNTTGLEYNDAKCPFYAFMKAVGYNHKSSSGAGGSFGFGKGAYYAASSVRTIFVSSIYGEDKFIFQGKARLTTHKNDEGGLRDYTGLLGNADGSPIADAALVPESLRRTEKGTDIIIMGFQDAGDWKESLIKSVLNNFWYAIFQEKLIVEVENTLINKENLESIITSFYSENSSDGSVNDAETWNPYPYFKAVKFAGDINTKYFEKEMPTLGKLKLYLLLKDGLPNRTVYMRSPKMTVFKKTDNRGFNYVGVFVCDNEKGNEILRQMENPQHNEWKKNNYLENDKPHADAKKAEDELKFFMRECLEELIKVESGKRQKITGLDKFLNIPEDLIAENEGSGEATGGGEVSEEKTKEETAVQTTQKESETPVVLEVKKKVQVAITESGQITDEGETVVLTGTPHEEEGGVEPTDVPGNNPGGATQQGNESGGDNVKKPLAVRCRVIAQKNAANEIEHLLKIFSNKDAKAEIELFAGVDNESESDDDMLTVISATKDAIALNANGNKIRSIPLVTGWNVITVKFDTNQKHSLKIKSYEI